MTNHKDIVRETTQFVSDVLSQTECDFPDGCGTAVGKYIEDSVEELERLFDQAKMQLIEAGADEGLVADAFEAISIAQRRQLNGFRRLALDLRRLTFRTRS